MAVRFATTPAVTLRAWAALALLLATTGSSAALPQRADYVVRIQEREAGALTVARGPAENSPGATQAVVDFAFLNNGRGPKLQERYTVDSGGTVSRYEARGSSTYGGVVDEAFTLAGGRLVFRSPSDAGDEAAPPDSLFVPLQATLAYTAELARSLLSRPGLAGVAQGGTRVVIERVAREVAQGPDGEVRVVLVSLTGLDTEPWYLWLRDDASAALFGGVWPGFTVLPRGYEGSGAALLARQTAAVSERLRNLNTRLAQPLAGLTRITNVRWFDAKAAKMRGPSDISVFDGRITAITPAITPTPAPATTASAAPQTQPDFLIDGRNRTLLPGLIDMHAHVWAGSMMLNLAGGVTSVRDMSNDNTELWRNKRSIDLGEVAGPHIVPAGFIEGESAFSSRGGIVAADEAAALAAVDWYAARGYRQIKLYNSIKPEWVRALTRRAHGHGMTVAGHVPAFMRAEQAVRAGYDELTHINQVLLNFVTERGDDSRTLARFTRVAEKARDLDLGGQPARRFIALLRQRGTVVDPTLATFEAMFTQRDGEPNPSFGSIAPHLPVLWRRGLLASDMAITATQAPRYRESYRRMVQLVGAMHRAGIVLVAGTDSTPGLALHRELELYVEAGIPPLEVLRIATWNGARQAGIGERAGSIEVGKAADLVLVDGDPSQSVGSVRNASLVIKGRVAYAPAQLYEAMGIKPFAAAAQIVRVPVASAATP